MSQQLSQKDLDVLQYIKANPGITKEAVINGLKDKYSRVTVFNIIKNLEAQKIIDVQKDKPNSQTHHVSINNDNLVAQHLQELDEFEQVFISLLEVIKEETSKFYSIMIDGLESYHDLQEAKTTEEITQIIQGSEFKRISEPYFLRATMFSMCIRIFGQLLQAYTIRSTFIWPIEIEDRKKLDQLISTLFNRLVNMQLKMSQIISETSLLQASQSGSTKVSGLPSRTDIIREMCEKLGSRLDLEEIQKYFKDFGLEEVAQPVLKLVSNIMNEYKKL